MVTNFCQVVNFLNVRIKSYALKPCSHSLVAKMEFRANNEYRFIDDKNKLCENPCLVWIHNHYNANARTLNLGALKNFRQCFMASPATNRFLYHVYEQMLLCRFKFRKSSFFLSPSWNKQLFMLSDLCVGGKGVWIRNS